MDEGEQPTETVIREMKEELGFDVEVKNLADAYLYKIKSNSDELKGVLVLSYVCNILGKSGEFEHEGEAGRAEFKAFDIEEIESLNMPDFYKKAIRNGHVK